MADYEMPPQDDPTYGEIPVPNLGVHPVPAPPDRRGPALAASVPAPSPGAVAAIPEGAIPLDDVPPGAERLDSEAIPAGAEPVREATDDEIRRFGDEQTKRDLKYIFEKTLKDNPDEKAQVIALAKKTGASTAVIEKLLPEFKAKAAVAEWDPEKFFADNRRIVHELLDRPELLGMYMKDEKVSTLFQTIRAVGLLLDFGEDVTPMVMPGDLGSLQAGAKEALAPDRQLPAKPTKEDLTPEKGQVPTVDDPKSGLAAMRASWDVNRKMSLLNSLQTKKSIMLRLGRDTYDLEKQIVDIQNELAVVHNYGDSWFGQTGADALQVVSSMVDTYKAGGALGVATAVATGGVTLAVTKNKAAAVKAAKVGWKVGTAGGAYLSSWNQEFGSIYTELEQDPKIAKDRNLLDGASAAYATAAATVEVIDELGPKAAMVFGPWRDAILKGEGKQFVKAMMQDATWKNIFKEAGKRWANGVKGETAEEVIQQFLQGLDEWVAAKISGQDIKFPTEKIVKETVAAGESAARGTAVLGAPTFALTTISQGFRKNAAERAAKHVQVIQQTAASDSPVLRAAPEFVAQQISEETADSGERVTHLYVDPQAFVKLFEQKQADPNQAATELMGPDGPKRVQEAIATGTKIEVPMEEYLTKWGPKEASAALAGDTTTREAYDTPNQMAVKEEAEKVKKQAEDIAKKEEDRQKKEATPFNKLLETFGEAIKATGKYQDKAVEPMVEAWRNVLETRAARDGVDVMQLAQTYIPRISATAGVTPMEFVAALQAKMTAQPTTEVSTQNQDQQKPVFKSVAYKNRETGQVVALPPGSLHDIMQLMKAIGIDENSPEFDKFLDSIPDSGREEDMLWEPGFMTWEDQFASRPKGFRSTDLFFQEDNKEPKPAPQYSQEFVKKFYDHERQRVDFQKLFNVVMGTYAGQLIFAGGSAPLALSLSTQDYEGGLAWSVEYFDWNHTKVGDALFGHQQGAMQTSEKNRDKLEKMYGGKGNSTRIYFAALQQAQNAGVSWMSGNLSVASDWTKKMYPRLTKLGLPVKYDPSYNAYVIPAEELKKVDLQAIFQKITPMDVKIFEQKDQYTPEQLTQAAFKAGEKLFGNHPSGFLHHEGDEVQIDYVKLSEVDNAPSFVNPRPEDANWEPKIEDGPKTGNVDTFEFVFKPSTGEGIDASEMSIRQDINPDWIDADGNIYMYHAEGLIRVIQVDDPSLVPGYVPTVEAKGPRVRKAGTPFFQGPGDMPRGFVVKMRNAVAKLYNLVVTEKADFSTFLHESGHIFIDILADAAENPQSSPQTKEDWQNILKFMGVNNRSEIKTEHEEKWAKAFEKWLIEGEIPSAKLAYAFTKFKLWLKQVYRTTFGAYFNGIDIDPTIKEVFERMFATDREIERMKAMMGGQGPLFRSPAEAGMTGEQWAAHLRKQEIAYSKAGQAAEKRALKGALRATTQWWKEELNRKLAEAQAQYDAQPAYRAWHFIRTGEFVDEKGAKSLRPGLPKLDMDAVKRILGEDAKRYTGRMQREGMDPDIMGQMFGFGSGEAMLKAIAALPSREDTTKAQANEAMKAQHPDVLENQKKLEEAIGREFHSSATLDNLLTEYKALRGKIPGLGGVPPLQAIKLAAVQIVDRMMIGKLSPSKVLNAEQDACNRAFLAAAQDDYETALIAKQQQILNFYIYKYLVDAKDDRDSFKALVKQLNTQKKQEQIGRGGKELLDVVNTVLEALGLRPPETDPQKVAERAGMDLLIQRLYAELTHPAFDEDNIRQLLASPVPFKNLTVKNMNELTAMFKQINKVASATNNVLMNGRKTAISSLLEIIRSEVKEESPQKNEGQPQSNSAQPKSYWMEQNISGINAAMTDPQILFKRLGKTAHKFFWRRYVDRRNVEDHLARKILRFFEKNWDKLPEEMQKSRYDLIDASGLKIPPDINIDPGLPVDRQWLWMLFLNMGNKSNLERLAGGFRWKEDELMGWIQGKLTKKEVEFLQSVWDLMDKELWPSIVEQYTHKNGAPPKKIEATKFIYRTKEGEQVQVTGGYFPAKYRADISKRGMQQDMASVESMDRAFPGASVMKGFTQSRARRYADVVDLNWSVVPSHIGDVIHYLAFERFVSDANRVINTADTMVSETEATPGMRTIIQRHLGEEYRHQIEQWLRVVANSRYDNAPRHMQKWLAALGWGRARFVMSTLGYSLGVAAGDLPTVLTAWTTGRVKTKYFAPAFIQTLLHGPSTYARNLDISKELMHRQERWRATLMHELSQVGVRGKDNRILHAVREGAWFFMEFVDRMTSNAIFEAALRQEMALHPELGLDEAAYRADEVVQGLLPSHDAAEQPAFLRDKRSIGALIAFYGYFLKQYNVLKEVWHPVAQEWQEAEGALEKGKAIAWPASKAMAYTLATMFVTNVLGELASGRGPEDDEKWEQWVLRKTLAAPFMMVPFVGGAAEAGIDKLVTGKTRKLSVRGAPALAGIQRVYDDIERAARAKRGSERVWSIIDATLTGANLPAAQVSRSGQYITDLATGYARPKDPVEATGRIIYGTRKGDPANPFTIHTRRGR